MSHVIDYVRNYGHIPFSEKPFCDEDNVAINMSFYMPLDKAVSPSFDDEPVPFSEACQKLFALRGNKHQPVGLVLVKGISQLLMAMAEQKRYSEIKVVACTDNYGKRPAVQFNAATYLLPTGEVLVMFRGTDDTLIGWEEDLNILTAGGTPSDELSLAYLAEAAKRFDGDLIVCGHSKGGYVAQYAVMNSPKEIRDRVKYLYNNDGPGLASYDYLQGDRAVYNELLPRYRHFVPQSSFIGMMLAHDDDYIAVKSSKLTGAMQHDMLTWLFDGDKLRIAKKGTNKKSKISDLMFHAVRDNITPAQSDAVALVVGEVIEGTGQRGLLDVKRHVGATLKGGKAAWKAIDKGTKKEFKGSMKLMRKSFGKATRAVLAGRYEGVNDRLSK
ncbi:MAG: DUF2974 domain-containing protein [Eubacterium sp.]|nr:DUF2974 domain-containing protein [Eubacterium sp.]